MNVSEPVFDEVESASRCVAGICPGILGLLRRIKLKLAEEPVAPLDDEFILQSLGNAEHYRITDREEFDRALETLLALGQRGAVQSGLVGNLNRLLLLWPLSSTRPMEYDYIERHSSSFALWILNRVRDFPAVEWEPLCRAVVDYKTETSRKVIAEAVKLLSSLESVAAPPPHKEMDPVLSAYHRTILQAVGEGVNRREDMFDWLTKNRPSTHPEYKQTMQRGIKGISNRVKELIDAGFICDSKRDGLRLTGAGRRQVADK